MNKILCLLVLYLAFSVKVYANDDVTKMYRALRNTGMTDKGAKILLQQAKHESHYGKKGLARYHAKNWWNVTTLKGGNRRIERELRGKRVMKRWAVWKTHDIAAREMTSYLKRKFPKGWQYLNDGNVEGYVNRLKANGYFTGSKKLYLRGLKG
mgnify:CR=1 FL=1